MENTYSVKNFKIFGNSGATVNFAPITFITGENSSGKSSIVKSLVLFEEYIRNCVNSHRKAGDFTPFNHFLNFSDASLKLGRYSTCYSNSSAKDDGMEFSYKVFSHILNQEVTVNYIFKYFENDDLDNGHLWSLSLKDANGKNIFEWRMDEEFWDYELVDISLAQFATSEKFWKLGLFNNLKDIKKDDVSLAFNLLADFDSEEERQVLSNFIKGFKSCEPIDDFSFFCGCWLLAQEFQNVGSPLAPEEDLLNGIKQGLNPLFNSGLTKSSILLKHLNALSMKLNNGAAICLDGLFEDLIKPFILEVISPEFVGNISYVGTSKVELKRLYTIGDNTDQMGKLIEEYLSLKKKWNYSAAAARHGHYPGDFIDKWIKRFNIGEKFELEYSDNGQGVTMYIDGRVVADLGYGITQLLTIMLNIEKAILTIKSKSYDYETEVMKVEFAPQTLIIEEPEVHLHPCYQSILADMFYNATCLFDIHFIIETHSEYLIRRSQVIVAKRDFSSNEQAEKECKFRTIYVPKNDVPYSLGYRKDGKFVEDFGPGFFDESAQLMFEIL